MGLQKHRTCLLYPSYIMRTRTNSYPGSLDARGTVQKKQYDVIYVDPANGNNNNLGDTKAVSYTHLDVYKRQLNVLADGYMIGWSLICCQKLTDLIRRSQVEMCIRDS